MAWRQPLAILLSLCLGFFLADALVSLVDDSLILFLSVRLLTAVRATVFLLAMLLAVVVYVLMGLTPMIPKRLLLPVTLFNPVAGLLSILLLVYFYGWLQQISWVISMCQALFGVGVLCWMQRGLKFRWPLVPANLLGDLRFSWRNLVGFLLVNVFVLFPATLAYLVLCTALAVGHFTEGFLVLRPGGLAVQVRDYVRHDGKTIRLVPMSHVGDAGFYRGLSQSFSTNTTVLLEGVSDNRNLLTNKISYKRMAQSLGLSEQQQEFQPSQGQLVSADVDVEQFATNTIGLLNLVMLVHKNGVNAATLLELLQYSPPPGVEEQLWDDLLTKRNQHLLEEIHAWLEQSETLVVPWGVAHMPGIAREIQKSGFRLGETREQTIIRFRATAEDAKGAKPGTQHREPD